MGSPLEQQESNSARDLSSEKALEANEVEQARTIETSPRTQKAGFGAKLKRHCVRFWWLHIIIFCICFLIIALCLVYVGLPRIAQHDVDRASIELTELKFLEPTSESIVVGQSAILHSPSKFTPTLDSFSAATYLVNNGTYAPVPMIALQMPSIHAQHPKSNVTVEAKAVKIDSLEQVTAYATAVLSNEFVTSALVGKTKLHLGKLPTTDINYNTTLTYKGLNGLKGFNVTNIRINLTATAGTPNLKGIAFIPNPSVLTVVMGNVTLQLSTAKAGVVGTATINDLTIAPGDNNFPMIATIEQPKVISSMGTDGMVEMLILGTDSIYNGQHLTYYEKALGSNNLKLNMNVKQILTDSVTPAKAA